MTVQKSLIVSVAVVLASALSITTMNQRSSAQTAQAQPQKIPFVPMTSAGPANIANSQAKLNGIIRQLQRDSNSYDGHRDKAVQLLIEAQQELKAAAGASTGQ
jgi:metal-dependent amidase/aminoacylase/carboxypeptidase family protein